MISQYKLVQTKSCFINQYLYTYPYLYQSKDNNTINCFNDWLCDNLFGKRYIQGLDNYFYHGQQIICTIIYLFISTYWQNIQNGVKKKIHSRKYNFETQIHYYQQFANKGLTAEHTIKIFTKLKNLPSPHWEFKQTDLIGTFQKKEDVVDIFPNLMLSQ